MRDNLRSIYNIPFILCLSTLLLNDLYFKDEYHNVLTGKLSDICGLFVLSHVYRVMKSLWLPPVVLVLAQLISSVIPNSYSNSLYGIFAEVTIVYIVAIPLFLIVFYFLKLRSKFDLIFYVLLFSLMLVLMEEWIF